MKTLVLMKQVAFSASVSLLLIALLGFSIINTAHAATTQDPTVLGPYKIGHTTMVIKDLSRNRDGTTSATPEGRELFLNIWYPSTATSGPDTLYTNNNPIYDGTHPGYPALTFHVTYPSVYGAKEQIPIAAGKFPLLVYSHGSLGTSTLGDRSLNETLASDGYIVVGVDHTGNTQQRIISLLLGLPNLGMGTGNARMVHRAQDISFAITQMLNPSANPIIQPHIAADKIGVYGKSLGGGTTMMILAGLQSAGLPPDTRVKAGLASDGTNFVGFTANDYANVKVPVMLYGDSDMDNLVAFPQLVNSPSKYSVDISGALHIAFSFDTFCPVMSKTFTDIELNPGDSADYAFLELELGLNSTGLAALCPPDVFNGISDQTFKQLALDASRSDLLDIFGYVVDLDSYKKIMPLSQQVSLNEMHRLGKWYVVSFFNRELKKDTAYDAYLKPTAQNPLVNFAKNCTVIPDHPLDFKNGDKITFTPTALGDKYQVTFSRGNALVDKGGSKLNLPDDGMAMLNLPFAFPMPGSGMNSRITVFSNGAIMATGTDTIDLSGATSLSPFYTAGSPWEQRGELLLNSLPTIAPLMNDLSPNLAGKNNGVFNRTEANRVIITWDQVPMCCTMGTATSTFQVIINQDGRIEMIYGNMGGNGPDYLAGVNAGTVGIGLGNATASNLYTDTVDFTNIPAAGVTLSSPNEEFYLGNGVQSCKSGN